MFLLGYILRLLAQVTQTPRSEVSLTRSESTAAFAGNQAEMKLSRPMAHTTSHTVPLANLLLSTRDTSSELLAHLPLELTY